MARYNRTTRVYYLKQRTYGRGGRIIKVFNLRAFADAVGVSYRALRTVCALEHGWARYQEYCGDWAFAHPEEFKEGVEAGTAQYAVYGHFQDTPPTKEQLDNPAERILLENADAARHRLWLVDPLRVLHVVWGIKTFADACGFDPTTLAKLKHGKLGDRNWIVKRSVRVAESAECVGYEQFFDKKNPVVVPSQQPGHRGYRGFTSDIRPIIRRTRSSKEPHKWRIVGLPNLIRTARTGAEFTTVIHGDAFDGKPSDADLERLGVKWDDLFPTPAWKFFKLHAESSDTVE